MSTNGTAYANSFAARSVMPTFGKFGSTLLARDNKSLRKSTPDSEALASSDEEVEQSRLRSVAQRRTLQNRRSSLLADHNAENRRLSFAGGNSHSPAGGSQPNTPGAVNDTWSAISPGAAAWNGTSYPFGNNIWGAASRDPPTRLQEVRQDSDSRLPFAIPTQPNPSVHRSMSFSVGQSEHDNASAAMDNLSRPGLGLVRRSSRPGNLANEPGLSRVNEHDDNDPYFGPPLQTQSNRVQGRAMSNISSTTTASAFRSSSRIQDPVYKASEVAIEDLDEPSAQMGYSTRNAPFRRMSEYQAAAPTRQPNPPPYSSSAFGASRNMPHWSSNLDFGQLDPIPQSRRHSFADVPTRRGSLGSNEEEQSEGYDAGSQGLSHEHDASYFNRNDVTRRITEQEVQQQLQQEHHQAVFGGTHYGIPMSALGIGAFHGPNPQPLYIVNFKCCRSDIFYIQEGSGLTVKDGDLVIVEADRGTDLGCIQHTNVSWEASRKYKARYAEQHFGWLMMFSQQTRAGAPNLFNPNAAVPGKNGPTYGTAIKDSDLKPKMIKRLAQAHEVQALQEKEGNEAKAKRVCQQKVVEHGLNMEILDAEFQMDGKKLTFYFFSNEYINFNALVTDLFKMYKTRIWMSAINPASFQSPVSSLGITPIYGNAPLGATTPQANNAYEEARDDSRYTQQQQPPSQMLPHRAMPQLYYGGYGQTPQMNDYASFTPNYQQQATDPFSNYNNQGYGAMSSRPQNMAVNRPESSGRSYQMPLSSNSLANQFGSLSLAR